MNVTFHRGDIVDQHRLASEGNLAHNSFTQREAHSLSLSRVPNLEAHPQFIGPVIEQQDGKDAVLNDGPHQFRRAIEQGLQVEGGVERVGHLSQVTQVSRFNPHILRV